MNVERRNRFSSPLVILNDGTSKRGKSIGQIKKEGVKQLTPRSKKLKEQFE
jgi:hypothetical protein